jgi:hypothetical protein
MHRGSPPPIQKAFDEIRFGPDRTLNLRESLPTATAARTRLEQWIRAKQVERAGEVLIITGRGNNSLGGVSVVRQGVLALFPSLRRRNIITGWQEHTPGSFVVSIASLTALFEAPKRRRERPVTPRVIPELAALTGDTLVLLHELAAASLTLLGIQDIERFIESEMVAKFAALSASITLSQSDNPDTALQTAIRNALNELECQ